MRLVHNCRVCKKNTEHVIDDTFTSQLTDNEIVAICTQCDVKGVIITGDR